MGYKARTWAVAVLWTVVAVLTTGAPAAANLLVNGSFESGPDPGIFLPLDPGSTAIEGWVVIRGNIDYIGSWWQSADGIRSLDLDGTPGFGGVEQTFDTTGYWWSDLGWVCREWTFEASGHTTTLQFYSLDASEECEGLGGPALDEVSVKSQPVPSDKTSWSRVRGLYR